MSHFQQGHKKSAWNPSGSWQDLWSARNIHCHGRRLSYRSVLPAWQSCKPVRYRNREAAACFSERKDTCTNSTDEEQLLCGHWAAPVGKLAAKLDIGKTSFHLPPFPPQKNFPASRSISAKSSRSIQRHKPWGFLCSFACFCLFILYLLVLTKSWVALALFHEYRAITLSHLESKQLFPIKSCWITETCWPEARWDCSAHSVWNHSCTSSSRVPSPLLDMGLTAAPLPLHHQTPALQSWLWPWSSLVW